MPPISSPNWVSQALVFSSASVAGQLATWKSSSLTSGIGLRAPASRPALRSIAGHVRFDAAERDDAALAAHRLDQRLGHRLAVGHAVEGDVRDVVRVEVPGMQVGGLVPLGDDVGAGALAGLDDRPRVRAVVGIDVDDAVAAGLGQDRLDVGDALLAVAFGDQRHVVRADRFGEGRAALVPGGVIGIGQRADRIDHGRIVGCKSPTGDDGGKSAYRTQSRRALEKIATPHSLAYSLATQFADHLTTPP